ncbi:MAG: indole-3-glycerol-phosphate synthase [Deltaproteobacteria bacterium]|nr:indole-3-glycerol-phosphate synthase [Deltaproteobacteria bacterium]
MSVLDAIVARTRARLAEVPPDMDALARRLADTPPPRDALAALATDGQSRIIAEVKRRSPSRGTLQADADPVAFAREYTLGGAAAISVLTEPERFGGSFEDLALVSGAVGVPTLCKDFVVDPRQVVMARAHGASLVLLIVAALDDGALVGLREQIEGLGMHALVEAHDRREVDRAVASGARIVGVNSRSLHTLVIDLAVAEGLRDAIPEPIVAVAESGIDGPADVVRLRAAGYRRFLVGTSLMTAPSPRALLAELVAAGDAASHAPGPGAGGSA